MSIRKSLIAAATIVTVAATGLAGCSTGSQQADAPGKDGLVQLKVGASPTPHAKILKFVNDKLAAKAGIKLQIVQYQDYIQPNETLNTGELDANYFQTVPYLKDQSAKHGYDFGYGKGIHLEPLGLYSAKLKSVKDIKDGAKIGIINDPTNQARALKLLGDNNLINLPKGKKLNVAQVQNSPQINVHKLVFQQVEGPQLIRSLDDVDAAVINGNFAQEGGKSPRDAIAIESTKDNPNLNILVWNKKSKKLAAIKKLDALLHSKEVRDFITKTWPDKSVIPAE